jgi:tripartite-type tricarboxylate transporter receptor subunit TctC
VTLLRSVSERQASLRQDDGDSIVLRLAPKCVLAVVSASAFALSPVSGDEYPARTTSIIVSQAAGGGNDILTRLFAERLQTRLGKRVVVENRVGAGGMIGATAGAKASPDGYTLLLLTNADVINQFMHRNASYDVQRDFAPISLLATAPLVLLTNGTLPIKTLPDLVAYAKANPKSLSYGSPGIGTPHHISGEMLQKATKIELNHVTYRGTAPSLNDLLGNQIPLIIATTISVMPHLQERKVFPIVTADQKRSSVLPDVPTLGEAGYPGFDVESVAGLVAPSGTPPAIVDRISAEIQAIAQEAELRRKLLELGYDVVAGTPDAFARKINADRRKYEQLVQELGLASN